MPRANKIAHSSRTMILYFSCQHYTRALAGIHTVSISRCHINQLYTQKPCHIIPQTIISTYKAATAFSWTVLQTILRAICCEANTIAYGQHYRTLFTVTACYVYSSRLVLALKDGKGACFIAHTYRKALAPLPRHEFSTERIYWVKYVYVYSTELPAYLPPCVCVRLRVVLKFVFAAVARNQR